MKTSDTICRKFSITDISYEECGVECVGFHLYLEQGAIVTEDIKELNNLAQKNQFSYVGILAFSSFWLFEKFSALVWQFNSILL